MIHSNFKIMLSTYTNVHVVSQLWCLARLFPMFVGEHIEEGDPHWENFLLTLAVVYYCCAPLVSEDWVAYLRMLIDHHKEFTSLYPSCRVTPKMHYMVHYPDIMCKYVYMHMYTYNTQVRTVRLWG